MKEKPEHLYLELFCILFPIIFFACSCGALGTNDYVCPQRAGSDEPKKVLGMDFQNKKT